MKKNLWIISALFLIVLGISLSGCGGGELPEEAKERLDAGLFTRGSEIIESMKAPRKENGTPSMQEADEVWCVLVKQNGHYRHVVIWRTGLNWTARNLYKSTFLKMECTNVAD